jgi:apolipoprotein N-acyltransferase
MTNQEKRRKRAIAFVAYAALFALGVLLFLWAHEYATRERGYIAYGGEVLFIGLPLFVWIVRTTAQDWRRDLKEMREREKWE